MPKKKPMRMPTAGAFDFETLIGDKEAKHVDKTDILCGLAWHKSDAETLPMEALLYQRGGLG